MITITDHAEGCVLAVRAKPDARKNALIGQPPPEFVPGNVIKSGSGASAYQIVVSTMNG